MDLSTNKGLMDVQNSYATKYENHMMIMMKETYEETDIKGNNIKFNSLKTEININHAHEPSSLFQVNCTKEKKLEVDNSLFSYSSFKKAMDVRTHNQTSTLDGTKRTIFDDAEYFAKNYCYKLLPFTFEQVDETIIQSEHNYSLSSLNSGSELEEDCSRTMDYTQVKEKNYKRRKTKLRDGEEDGEEDKEEEEEEDEEEQQEMVESCISDGERKMEVEPSSMFFHPNEDFTAEDKHRTDSVSPETENSNPVQPFDLSVPPLVQEEKTDGHLRERPNSIVGNDEVAQPDSDKENVNSEMNGILVTITRPDEKENYQPCDLFLNDIARLVPWLIDKDCFEVDILDRTCDHHDEFRNHRRYYVISEATWRIFHESNERVVLTNDQSLGQPLIRAHKDEKPSYLVFDQFSLAKCLADYCKEIGGCFEYSCIEDGNDEQRSKEELLGDEVKNIQKTEEEVKKVDEIVELVKNLEKEDDKVDELAEGVENMEKENDKGNEVAEKEKIVEEEDKEVSEIVDKVKKVEDEVKKVDKIMEKVKKVEEVKDKEKENDKVSKREQKNVEAGEKAEEEKERGTDEKLETRSAKKRKKREKEVLREEGKETVCVSNTERKIPKKTEKKKSKPAIEDVNEVRKRTKPGAAATEETKNGQIRGSKRRMESPGRPELNNCRITTRSKSTSGSETSQKSNKPVSRKRKKESEAPTLPTKLNKPAESVDLRRKTRSGKLLEEVKANKPTGRTGKKRKRSEEGSRGKAKVEEVIERRLRSQKVAEGRGEVAAKARNRKRLRKR